MLAHMVAGTTSGPSVDVHGWVAWVIIAGALTAAVTFIWKCIWPITKAAVQFTEQWGQLTEILPKLASLAEKADELLALPAAVADLQDGMKILLAGHHQTRRGDSP